MSRDPFIDADVSDRSAQVIQIESLGRGGIAAVVSAVILCALCSALSIGMAWRAIDRSQIAEREARVAVDQFQNARIELAKRGIFISQE